MSETLEGFVILGPGFPAVMGFHTFGRTMTEAWERHIGPGGSRDVGERATMRHLWAQKGWRPVPATLTVHAERTAAEPATSGGEHFAETERTNAGKGQ